MRKVSSLLVPLVLAAVSASTQKLNVQTQIKGQVPPANGGFGLDLSGANGCPKITNGVWSISAANCGSGTTTTTPTSPGGGTVMATDTPTASPAPGAVPANQLITFADTTPGALIYYTASTSGTPPDPTTSSSLFTSALSLTAATIYKVFAIAPNYTASAIQTFAYTLAQQSTTGFVGPQTASFSSVTLGDNPNLNGFLPFCPSPTSCSGFYQNISALPVDTVRNAAFHNTAYNNYENAGINFDATSAAGSFEYHVYKPSLDTSVQFIPTVSQDAIRLGAAYNPETVDTLFPWKSGMSVEGGGNLDGCTSNLTHDQHATVVNVDRVEVTESYVGGGQGGLCNGKIQNYNTTVWALDQPIEGQLPGGQTSADAAGLPTFGLTVRYEDIVAGIIKHGLRATVPHLSAAFYQGDTYALVASPAKHSAGMGGGPYQFYPGQRLRLKPGVDITTCGPQAQVVLQAMKDYGEIIADIGNANEIQGVYDSRIDQTQMACLSNFKWSQFEVVSPTPLRGVDLTPETATGGNTVTYDQTAKSYASLNQNNGTPWPGATTTNSGAGTQLPPDVPAPVITAFSASATTVALGSPLTFTATATNARNMVINNAGRLVNGSITIYPTQNATYTLTAYNGSGYDVSGRTSGTPNPPSITVTVSGPTVATPAFSPAPGPYTSAQTVTISDATAGAAIHYTVDSTQPTCYSPTYSMPLTVSAPTNINAIACKSGMVNSAIATANYNVQIAGATPSVLGTANQPLADGTTQSVSYTFAGGTGAVVATNFTNGTSAPTVSCGGVAATLIGSRTGQAWTVATYRVASMAAGNATCTATYSFNAYSNLVVAEVSGTSGVDMSSTGNSTAYPLLNCGSLATTGTNRLGIVFGQVLYSNVTASTGYTSIYAGGSGGYSGMASISLPSASTTAMTLNTNNDSSDASCVAFALKP